MRASTIGWLSSTRRPTAATILLTMRSRCASSLNGMWTCCSLPWRSTKQFWWPLIRMSLIDGSLSSGSSGPRPTISSTMSSTSASSSAPLTARRSCAGLLQHEFMHLAAHLVLRQALQRDEVDLLDQHAMQAHARVDDLVGRFRRAGFRLRLRLAGRRNDHRLLGDGRRLGRARLPRVAVLQRREAAGHADFLNRPLPIDISERDFFSVAITSSGRMMRFRSLTTLALASISCSGTPRSTASRTSR